MVSVPSDVAQVSRSKQRETLAAEPPLVIATRNRILPVVVVGLCGLTAGQSADAYRLAQRWTNTASGATGAQGNAITLTWSFVPDGSHIHQFGGSDLLAFLDQTIGTGPGGSDLTQRPWFDYFETTFDRWSEISGVTYVYEPQDDGVPHGNFPGILGVRGDIRIGGVLVDGGGTVLGYNHPPNNGDMVLDTSEVALFSNSESDFLSMRTLIAHEHGHGLGLAHVDSTDADFLMELGHNLSFDGPQLDDIRGIQRGYGDALEKNHGGLGNNSVLTATPFGGLPSGGVVSIGTDGGPDTVVETTDVDFVSIDDNSDIDFFSFDLSTASMLDLVLTPLGPTYNEGPRNGTQTPTDSAAVSDLSLTVFDADGVTILANANSVGPGGVEQIIGLDLPSPGRYFARIIGDADDVQLYRLDVTALTVPEPSQLAWIALGFLGLWCLVPAER